MSYQFDYIEEESQAVSSLTATPKSMKSVDLIVYKNLHDENNDEEVEEVEVVEESQGATSSSSKTSLKRNSDEISTTTKCKKEGKGVQRGGGMPKSQAWDNFTVVPGVQDVGTGTVTVKCNFCSWRGVYSSNGPLRINRIQAHIEKCEGLQTKKNSVTPSLKPHTMPRMCAKQKTLYKRHLSHWFYRTGTSFYRISDPYFYQSQKLLREDVPKITRKELAGPLLEDCYQEISILKDQATAKSGHKSLGSDGWTNTHGEPIINYIGRLSSGLTFFEESVPTGTVSHDGTFIATDIERVIRKAMEKGEKVSGCTTDNTATNKKAWRILQNIFPGMFFQGCICHGFHLLVGDLMKKIPAVGEVTEAVKEIVFFVYRHHKVLCDLKERRLGKGGTGEINLQKPAPTRWGAIVGSMKSVQLNYNSLYEIFNEATFIKDGKTAKEKESRNSIRSLINKPTFLDDLRKAINTLNPICKEILKFESDACLVSDVYHSFEFLKNSISVHKPDEVAVTILEQINHRWDFMYADSHGISYVLDPRYLGELMDFTVREQVEGFICDSYQFAGKGEDYVFTAYTELNTFKKYMRTYPPARLKAVKDGEISIYDWWDTCMDPKVYGHLREIALMVFSVLPSGSSCERNFSSFGFIQSKLRNRLSDGKTEKLVFVYSNMKELDKVSAEEEEELVEDEDIVDFPDFSHFSLN